MSNNQPRHHLGKENYIQSLRKMSAAGKKVMNQSSIYNNNGNISGANKNTERHENAVSGGYGYNEEGPGDIGFEKDVVSKLNKIGSLLQVIDDSVNVMNQRIVTNEEAINSVANYIQEKYNHNPLYS